MILSFANKTTEDVYDGRRSKAALRFPENLHRTAQRKLTVLNRAVFLQDVRMPPSNHLEALKGNLKGKHSIRINDQWRIVFRWTDAGVEDVEITDYH